MEKTVKKAIREMSLKKALVLVSFVCLSAAVALSTVSILGAAALRQKILETRPVIITDYESRAVGDRQPGDGDARTAGTGGYTIRAFDYSYGELSAENQVLFWGATAMMAGLPVVFVLAGAGAVAKIFYELKLRRPIRILKNGMAHIAEQDLDFHAEYDSGDELGALCGAFEHMRSEVHRSSLQMWDMLRERKALTASISHDLRTPITVVKGYTEYLERAAEMKNLSEDALKTTVSGMVRAVERLERYVACVNDIQKIEDIELVEAPLDLKRFINDMRSDLALAAGQRGRHFELHDLSEREQITADRDILCKILENLFDNALRFSVDKVVLTVEESEKLLSFIVRDDGPGFAEEDLEHAADFFYSSGKNGGNFGIGLTICRILCGKSGAVLELGNHPQGGAEAAVRMRIEEK